MTEDATNAEEWGPTTTTMASISKAARTFDEYERIVQVLRGRLAINLPIVS
jgi:epsin